MGFLTDIQENKIITKKGKVLINPAFNIVLEIQQLFRNDGLDNMEKYDIALYMLVRNNWNLKLYSVKERCELLDEIYKTCIHVKKRQSAKRAIVPVLDFSEDGEYIYASFMQDYGIDLIDMQGILSWRKFIALFDGLSADTKIKRVMRIRDMEVPSFNGKNQKQIQDILELKSYYALPVHGGGGKQGLDMLFETLERMANQ